MSGRDMLSHLQANLVLMRHARRYPGLMLSSSLLLLQDHLAERFYRVAGMSVVDILALLLC